MPINFKYCQKVFKHCIRAVFWKCPMKFIHLYNLFRCSIKIFFVLMAHRHFSPHETSHYFFLVLPGFVFVFIFAIRNFNQGRRLLFFRVEIITIITIIIIINLLWSIGSGGLWSLKLEGTKLAWFFHQNECTKSFLPYF